MSCNSTVYRFSPRTLVVGRIHIFLFLVFWFIFDFSLDLMPVQIHQAEIIAIKRLIQGRNNVTMVRVT